MRAYLGEIRSWALRRVVVPGADLYFGQHLMQRLRFLEKAQWWDRAQIDAYRSEHLQNLVAISYAEVPFYRALMKNAGIVPGDIRKPEDLHQLPIVTKGMLRSAYPRGAVRETGQKTHEAKSAGTTGADTIVREDSETRGICRSSFLLSLEWAGWRFGEAHVQTGVNLERSRDRSLKDLFLQCHYVSALDLSEEKLDAVLEDMAKTRIKHLWGYPRSLYFLARRAQSCGRNVPLQSVVTWGDNLYRHYRNTIENAFHTRVFDTYGCGEGFQVAAQCGVDQNYHVHELDVIVELLDQTGRPVAPGQPGNVVVTRLHPGPMPLIRYQVGDVAVRGPLEGCACGRTLERLGSVEGRDTDIVNTPSGERLTSRFFAAVLEVCPEIATIQVTQAEEGAITVSVVPAIEPGQPANWRQKVETALKQRGAQELRIDIDVVKDIPRVPSGKRLLVVNKLLSAITIGAAKQQPPAKDYWDRFAKHYRALASPLIPAREDLAFMEGVVQTWAANRPRQGVRAVLLGVTPGIVRMRLPQGSTLTAVDRSLEMVRAIWPGDIPGKRRAVCGNWLSLPQRESSCDIAIGDGSINCLRYPEAIRGMIANVHRVIVEDGIFMLRAFVQPDRPEDPEKVFQELFHSPSFHHFKLRLMMAMQKGAERGTPVNEVYEFWAKHNVDRGSLIARTGWARGDVDSIELHRGPNTVHTFPTLAELRCLLSEYFQEISISIPSYPLGERCPTLVLQPRAKR